MVQRGTNKITTGVAVHFNLGIHGMDISKHCCRGGHFNSYFLCVFKNENSIGLQNFPQHKLGHKTKCRKYFFTWGHSNIYRVSNESIPKIHKFDGYKMMTSDDLVHVSDPSTLW